MRTQSSLGLVVPAVLVFLSLSTGGAQPPGAVTVFPNQSVQAAVDSAPPGAVICLPPGTWRENLVIGKPVVLRGAGPAETAIVAREPGLPALRVESTAPVEVALEGLKVGGGQFAEPYENHGVLVRGRARLLLADCAVEGNEWHGVLVEGEAQVALTRCRVAENWVYGIAVDGGAEVVISNCVIEGNGSHGIGVLASGPVTVEGCKVRGNGAHGIAVGGDSPAVTIARCTVEGNGGSGVVVGGLAQVTLEGNLIRGNGEYGVALYEAPCSPTEGGFAGWVSGGRNAIPAPGSPDANGHGAFCPAEVQFLGTESGGALDRRR